MRRVQFIWRYLRGKAPWDSGVVPPEVVDWVEGAERHGINPGCALDLGCGTGTTSIYLAQHGWDVVGVDFAPNAIWQARQRAKAAGVLGKLEFHTGDVTNLSGLSKRFDLAIDIGCLHTLTQAQQRAYAKHLTRLLAPGATFLLYGFTPRRDRQGREVGIDSARLEKLFHPVLDLVSFSIGQDSVTPIPSGWYNLRRSDKDG